MPDKIKAIIFDADGMVIKGERPSLRLSRDYNVPMKKLDQFFNNEFKGCILGKDDLKKVVAPYLPIWGWKNSVDDLLHFWFAESYHNDEETIAEVKKLRTAGIICILATNQEKYRVQFMKNEMGLAKVFDYIIASSDIGYKKPQKEFFEVLMKLIPKIQPLEILFFDDREENIKAALEFGFNGQLFTNISNLQKFTTV